MSPSSSTAGQLRQRFRELHDHGILVMPNPGDIGTGLLLQYSGAQALATTSSGLAWSLGLHDNETTREQLVAHVTDLCDAVSVPVNVDAEDCHPDAPGGIATTIELLAEAGAAGVSIEDWDSSDGRMLSLDEALRRVETAVEACAKYGLVLTARTENHLHGLDDFDDTLDRLAAYRDAGADCLYAPLAHRRDQIEQIVELGAPVNVLAAQGAPTRQELAALGVRRISTGGSLSWVAATAIQEAVIELLDEGTSSFLSRAVPADERDQVLDTRRDD